MGYEQEFENQLLRVRGNSFQDLFYRLMKACYPDFMPIKPNGPLGDSGCDGYLSCSGKYFQVYGPDEPYLKSTLSYAEKKISTDFNKLYNGIKSNGIFPSISCYCFVFNNKTDASLTMKISGEIELLKNEYVNIDFEIWDNQRLMEHFCKLSINAQQIVLSHYAENIYGVESYLEKIEIENMTQDIDYIRGLKNCAQTLMNLINEKDFVAPFRVDVLDDIEFYCNNLGKIEFNNNNLIQLKNECLSNIYELLALIHKYTKVVDYMAVMERIEPWGEIKDENFYDVRDRMFQTREKTFYSIENLLDQESVLIKQLKNIKN